MKKISALIVTAILLVSSVIVPASAYGKAHSRNCTITCTGFVDKNNDGICDNRTFAGKGYGCCRNR